VNFEWDEDKNQENIRKHGFDFADAWEIFEAPMLTALDTREDYGEERWNWSSWKPDCRCSFHRTRRIYDPNHLFAKGTKT
jgi:uncharacterized DUF497 family protein